MYNDIETEIFREPKGEIMRHVSPQGVLRSTDAYVYPKDPDLIGLQCGLSIMTFESCLG